MEIEKNVEHERDGDTSTNWCSGYTHQRIGKRNGGPGNKRASEDHQNYSIIEIRHNTKKSPRDLRKLTVTFYSYKKPSAKAGMKNSKRNNNNNNNESTKERHQY